ncbi:alpha/beta fold hydrolase [Aquibium microcysteis]|uniref:alpha/beta fold hydrolase n=1 Tax=Aquibium microcysteis TaxID=675281 RepID=UPI00165D2033|nr:alpha/beta hydrolase [Aquibium microcysteis]
MSNPLIHSRDAFAARHPEQRAILGGRDWGYLDVGKGPVLVLIPGTLGRGDIFWNQIEALSGRLRIVAVSYPDSGGVVDWAQDLLALFGRLGIGRATVLGSSLGGYLAQQIAGIAPERVEALVAANTLHSAEGIKDRPPYSLDLMAAPIGDLRAGFGAGMEIWRKAHPDQSDLVDLLLQEAGGRILEPELRARLDALKTAQELPPMGLPGDRIFTVEADDDPLIPPQMRAAVRARLRPAVAYRYLHGGHFPYIARPALYTAMLEQIMGLSGTGHDWGAGPERSA